MASQAALYSGSIVHLQGYHFTLIADRRVSLYSVKDDFFTNIAVPKLVCSGVDGNAIVFVITDRTLHSVYLYLFVDHSFDPVFHPSPLSWVESLCDVGNPQSDRKPILFQITLKLVNDSIASAV